MRRILLPVLVLAVLSTTAISLSAAVPQLISYQGRLTDAAGDPVADGSYQIKFIIYDSPSAGTDLWNSGFQSITVTDGLFSVNLGASPMPPLPHDLFTDTSRWLGVTVDPDPELTPRTRITSYAYVYHALRADTAGTARSIEWANVVNKPQTIGELGCAADEVPIFDGANWVCQSASSIGSGGGWVDDGSTVRLDSTSDSVGIGTTTLLSKLGVMDSVSSTSLAYGLRVNNRNSGSGGGIAGFFEYADAGTGQGFGLAALSTGNSGDTTFGMYSASTNLSAGPAIGGLFQSSPSGTGDKIGTFGLAENSAASAAIGSYATATNTGSGQAFGGWFRTTEDGTGGHFGVLAEGRGNSGSANYGIRSVAENNGSGEAIAGSFFAFGTGGASTGNKIALETQTSAFGSDSAFGIQSLVTSADSRAVGIDVEAASSNSRAIGLRLNVSGVLQSDGVYSAVTTSSGTAYGIRSNPDNTGSGRCYGFRTDFTNSGTGSARGVYASIGGTSSESILGVYGEAGNSGTGDSYGVFGRAFGAGGSGIPYGVYGMESAGGAGAAVYAAGDFVASGTKSAVVRTSQGKNVMYATEATEVWFEDIGEGQLINGHARIELDALFTETVVIDDQHPIRVFIQPTAACNGTWVDVDNTGFDVYELMDGTSNATFNWRVMAKRKGFENERMRPTDVGKFDMNLYPERAAEIEAMLGDDDAAPRVSNRN